MRICLLATLLIFFIISCSKKKDENVDQNLNEQIEEKVETSSTNENASYELEINSNESSEEVQNNEEAPSEDVTIEQDLIPEIKELMDKALAGDPDAQLFLGQRYQEGNGIDQNIQEAMRWLKLSAEQGNVYAPHILKKIEEVEAQCFASPFRLLAQKFDFEST